MKNDLLSISLEVKRNPSKYSIKLRWLCEAWWRSQTHYPQMVRMIRQELAG